MINGRSKRTKKSKAKHVFPADGGLENEETIYYMSRLGMSKVDVDELYSCFVEITGKDSKSKGKSFSLGQFYHWAKIRNDSIVDFHADIFTVLEDGNIANGIDFREFGLVMWNFLAIHEEAGTTLPDFIYHIYDKAGAGVMKNAEVRDIIWKLHGKTGEHVGRIIEVLDYFKLGEGALEIGARMKEFSDMNKLQPFLCYPAFRLMKHLRLKICGTAFWMRLRSKRRKRFQESVDLWEMLAKEPEDEATNEERDARLPRMVPARLAREVEFDDYYLYKQSEIWAHDALKKVRDREKRLGIERPKTPVHAKWGTGKVTMSDAENELRTREERAKAAEIEKQAKWEELAAGTKDKKKKKKKKKKGKKGGDEGSAQESRSSSFQSMRKISSGMGRFL